MKLKDGTIKAIGISDFYELYSRTFYKEGTINNKSKYYVTRTAYVSYLTIINYHDNFEFNMPVKMGIIHIT